MAMPHTLHTSSGHSPENDFKIFFQIHANNHRLWCLGKLGSTCLKVAILLANLNMFFIIIENHSVGYLLVHVRTHAETFYQKVEMLCVDLWEMHLNQFLVYHSQMLSFGHLAIFPPWFAFVY